jgi:hypothetical protein
MDSISPNRVGGLALHIAIEYAENTFFKKSWANSLLPPIKNELLERFANGTPGEPNSRKKSILCQFDPVRISATGPVEFL